jgi:hypothetical protein
MTQEEYLEALRSGAKMNFNDLIKLIPTLHNDPEYTYALAQHSYAYSQW